MTVRLAVAGVIAVSMLIVASNDIEDRDQQQIRSTSESAVLAWIDDGAPGLYNYLASDTKGWCSVDQVARNLTYRIDPSIWTGTRDFVIQGETAEAMVRLVIDGHEWAENWSFVREDGSWRVHILPGLGDCTDPSIAPSLPETGSV